MEIQYTIEPEHNLIRLRAWGEVTTDEFIRNARTLYNDPLFKKGMNTLADVSEAEFKPSFREAILAKDFVAAIEQARGTCRWAIYDAGRPEARRYLELYTRMPRNLRIEARLFDDADEAEEWVMG